MVSSQIERRMYNVPPLALFGACLTALGQMRAHIERQDVERGAIVATLGGGVFAPANVLVLTIRAEGGGASELSAAWRARGLGRDRRVLTTFLAAVERLIGAA
jgi:hypothetical protein